MLGFEDVHIGYTKKILGVQNLQLSRGKCYALIGANGVGKSTFLKTICGQISAIQGQITLNNQRLDTMSTSEKSKAIAFVDTHFKGVDFLSVYEYVALARTPYTNFLGTLHENDHEIIASSIQKLGLWSKRDAVTTELSDGERQLISIARAIAQTPNVLLMDEPTAFLDYGNRLRLIETVQQLAKDQDICIVLSSHDIELCVQSQLELLLIDYASRMLLPTNAGVDISTIIEMSFKQS